MNVTDASGNWELTWGFIRNRKTGESRHIQNPPTASQVSGMNENRFIKKCADAFASGTWTS